MARPSSYKPEFAEQAEKLCKLGATDVELADFFGVSIVTINAWKRRYEEFLKSIKKGKEPADDRAEESLYHRAVGYTFESEKVFQFQGKVVRAKTREHVPPDTTACIFWLKNRRAGEWRDRTEHVVRNETNLSDDELAHIAAGGSNGAVEAAGNTKKLN